MRRRPFLAAVAAGLGSLAGCARGVPGAGGGDDDAGDGSAAGDGTGGPSDGGSGGTPASPDVRVETVATGLTIPWGAAWRDDGLYLTERPGRVVRVVDGTVETVADLTGSTAHRGEGGLLGLALHPDDPDLAYVYQTYQSGLGVRNRVRRHDVADGWAVESTVVDDLPGASFHDGGRVAVGPDGALYVTVGDAGSANAAQDPARLHGSVLRLTLDGEPHPDNPLDGGVFTYGHRNPQGLAWRGGACYATEHGPDHDDEVNRLEAGGNYGWPVAMGPAGDERFVDPLVSYTPTIAPASATFYDGPVEAWRGDLFFGTLAGEHLHRVRLGPDDAVLADERLLDGAYGRLRTAFAGPDGHLYLTTSNRDGRGSAAREDDRVLRVVPA